MNKLLKRLLILIPIAIHANLLEAAVSQAHASANSNPCVIRLTGADHLGAHREFVVDSLSRLTQGVRATLRADFIDVFYPEKLVQLLQFNGVTESATDQTTAYLNRAFAQSRSGQFNVIDGGLTGHKIFLLSPMF